MTRMVRGRAQVLNMPDEQVAQYEQHTEREDGSHAGMFAVVTCAGVRLYVADDFAHAREQHDEGFPEEGSPFAIVELGSDKGGVIPQQRVNTLIQKLAVTTRTLEEFVGELGEAAP